MGFQFTTDKKIILTSTDNFFVNDMYAAWKAWALDHLNLSRAFRPVGGEPIGGGTYNGDTYFLASDWQIVPYDSNHRVIVDGNLYPDTDNPTREDMFSARAGRTIIIIQRLSSKTQTVAVGSGVLPSDVSAIAIASRDAILSDGIPFPGSYIDTAISESGAGLTEAQSAALSRIDGYVDVSVSTRAVPGEGLTVSQTEALSRVDGYVDVAVSTRSVAGDGLTVSQTEALSRIDGYVDVAVSTRAIPGEGLTEEQILALVEVKTKIDELWKRFGLDPDVPLVISGTDASGAQTAGDIELTHETIDNELIVTRTA